MSLQEDEIIWGVEATKSVFDALDYVQSQCDSRLAFLPGSDGLTSKIHKYLSTASH